MSKLFGTFATRFALESVALKAATLMPILLLQKPARTSKAKEHITYLELTSGPLVKSRPQ